MSTFYRVFVPAGRLLNHDQYIAFEDIPGGLFGKIHLGNMWLGAVFEMFVAVVLPC